LRQVGWEEFRSGLPLARDLASRDIEAVPDVDAGDGQDEGRQGSLVVVVRGVVPHRVGDGIRTVAQACDGFGQGEGGASQNKTEHLSFEIFGFCLVIARCVVV
jgi:hypothetical protein